MFMVGGAAAPRPPMTLANAAAGFAPSGLLGSGGATFRCGSGGLGSSSSRGDGGSGRRVGRLGGASSSGSGSGVISSCPPPSPNSM